jgi:nicotinamide-nucleotide amidase
MTLDARHVVHGLVEAGLTVGTAESLTGGLLGAALTAVPGSSAVYAGGVVSYATRVKTGLLGVPAEVVEAHGVVSAQCAVAMAEAARELLGTDLAVSTTGVAGPDLQEGQPVGTVFVAVAGPGETVVQPEVLTGDRALIREETVQVALRLLSETVRDRAPEPPAGS